MSALIRVNIPVHLTINSSQPAARSMTKNKICITVTLPLALLAAIQMTGASAKEMSGQQGLISAMQECSTKAPDAERLACFDSLVESLPKTEVVAKVQGEPNTLPENLGGGKFDNSSEKPEGVRGLVTSCQKSQDGRWFYIFKSGQVWKQTDRSKRRYRDCNFYVTIFEDGFGYLMQVDDETRTTRIKRTQ